MSTKILMLLFILHPGSKSSRDPRALGIQELTSRDLRTLGIQELLGSKRFQYQSVVVL